MIHISSNHMYGRAERHTCVSSRWHLLLLGPHSHSLAPPLATGEQPQRATSGRGCWRGTQVTAVLNAGCLSYPPGCFDSPRSSSAWCSPRSCCVCLLPALVSVCALSRVRLFATFWTVSICSRITAMEFILQLGKLEIQPATHKKRRENSRNEDHV